MTSNSDNDELMSAAFEQSLSAAEQADFNARLANDADFRAEWESFRDAMSAVTSLRGAPEHRDLAAWAELHAGAAPNGPDLRKAIQRKVQERKRGRYYLRDGSQSFPWTLVIAFGIILLFVAIVGLWLT